MTASESSDAAPVAAVLRFRDAERNSTEASRFRRRVRQLAKVATGAYADVAALTPEAAHELSAREVLRRLDGVALSHVSAAVLWGLPVPRSELSQVHLTAVHERRRGRSRAGYWIHGGLLVEDARVVRRGVPVADVVNTISGTAALLGIDWGVAVADSALHQGLVLPGQLEPLRHLRNVTGAGFARAVPDLASDRAESPGESLARVRLVRDGWAVEEQVVLTDVPGAPRVDFRVGRWVVVEFDGRAKYRLNEGPEAAMWAEKRRRDLMTHCGYEVVRPVWADLFPESRIGQLVEAAVARVERRHGHQGEPRR